MSIVPPKEAHVTYQLQYRSCGKASCKACHAGRRHGPYWYAFWSEAQRLRSAYIGKVMPPPCRCSRCQRIHREAGSEPACHPERPMSS